MWNRPPEKEVLCTTSPDFTTVAIFCSSLSDAELMTLSNSSRSCTVISSGTPAVPVLTAAATHDVADVSAASTLLAKVLTATLSSWISSTYSPATNATYSTV